MPFCPNCSAKLASEDAAACWNCEASFSATSAWHPVASPPGEFRRFKRLVAPKKPPAAERGSPVHRSKARRVVEGVALAILGIFGAGVALLIWLFLNLCLICR
jgi:hypothetical protein